jgi:haloalkane dehalogenase
MGCKTKLQDDVKNAYSAPFPDNTYKAAARKFPFLVPTKPSDEATPFMQMARKELAQWNKPVLIMFSDGDPITGHLDKFFYKLIPTATQNPMIKITGAGHFLQEDKGGGNCGVYWGVYEEGGCLKSYWHQYPQIQIATIPYGPYSVF